MCAGMRNGRVQGSRVGYFRRETLEETGVDTHNIFATWVLLF